MPTDARTRILAAAIECFGTKGYEATKIADIERAAGLSVGAGGTYRHFESKRAIMDAVLEAVLAAPDAEVAPPGDDVEAIAHQMLDYMRVDLVRIYYRDLDEFPDQRRQINERTVDTSYRVVANRIAAANPSIDADAAAAVLLGSLINFRVNEALIGPDANGIDRDRFIRTWGAIYRSLLRKKERPTGERRLVRSDLTDAVPLEVEEPVLAARLVDQFRSELRTHLTDDELEFLDSLVDEPRLDVALLDGTRALRITYFGGHSSIGWDGTADDALGIVTELAESFAGSISSHHWHHAEGWRSWQNGADSP